MNLTTLLFGLCLIIGVLSAALEPNIGPGLARDPAAVNSKFDRRGCYHCGLSVCSNTRRSSISNSTSISPDDGPPSNGPNLTSLTTADSIFGTTNKKNCPKVADYGCGKGGYCWRACGFWNSDLCWIALANGVGPWQRCKTDEECKKGKVPKAECCVCERHEDCGCGCH